MSQQSVRLMLKCDHSQPIYIPCESCVASRLARVVRDERESASKEVKESYEAIIAQANKYIDGADALNKKITALVMDKMALNKSLIKAYAERDEINKRLQAAEIMLSANRAAEVSYTAIKIDDDNEGTLN